MGETGSRARRAQRHANSAATSSVPFGAVLGPPPHFLSELGTLALAGTSPTALSEAAVAIFDKELGLGCCGVTELIPNQGLRLLAAAGCLRIARDQFVLPWAEALRLVDRASTGTVDRENFLTVPLCEDHRAAESYVCAFGSPDPTGVIIALGRARNIPVAQRALLGQMATTLAAAFSRFRLEDALRRAADESRILSEIARIIGSSLDIDDVYPRFAEEARKLIDHDRIAIALLDLDRGTATPTYVAGADVAAWRVGVPRPIEGTSVAAVVSARTSVIVRDSNVAQFKRRYPLSGMGQEAGLRSLLAVPLLWRDEIIGILSFRSTRGDAFTERDGAVAERVAASIANAVANAQLHAEVKRRAHEQAVLAEIGRIVGSSRYIDEVFVRLAESIRKLIPFDHMTVTSLNWDLGTSRVVYAIGESLPDSYPGRDIPLSGTATEAVALGRAALLISPEAVRNPDGHLSSMRSGLELGFLSALAVPLFYRNDVVGTLILRSKQARAYELRELNAAERIGFQMAGAVATSMLYGQLERVVYEGTTLVDLGAAAAAVRDLDTLFRLVNETVGRLIKFDRIEFGVIDGCTSSMTLRYAQGVRISGYGPGTTVHADDAEPWPQRWHARFGQYDKDGSDPPEVRKLLLDAGLKSWIQVPLRSRDHLVGVVALQSFGEGQYDEEDLRILMRVGVQIGPAVDGVLACERAEDEARERALIGQLAHTLGTIGDRAQLFETFAEQSRLLVPFDRLAINRVNLSQGALEYVHVSGAVIGDRVPGSILPLAGTVSEVVAVSKKPLLLRDGIPTEGDGSLRTSVTSRVAAFGFHSSLAFPLLVGGNCIGTLHFNSRSYDAYAQRHLEIGTQIAGLLTATLSISRVAPGAAGDESRRAPFEAVASRPGDKVIEAARKDSGARLVRAVVVDSHALCRDGLSGAFDGTTVEVVGESVSLTACRGSKWNPPPEVVLWEFHAEDVDEVRVLSEFSDRLPAFRVAILSNEGSVDVLRKALAAGARGFILKGISREGLVAAVHEVATGGVVIDPGLLAILLSGLPTPQLGPTVHDAGLLALLSERDVHILQAIASGKSNAEIAKHLGYSQGTIKNRVTKMYRLIGVHDRAGVTAFALRAGVVK